MARGGINKALVHVAREALLARGLRPSIDLVRVELGNTGSKSTIQRFLKELNNTHAATHPSPSSTSEKLLTLVNSLAEQLNLEAREAVAEAQAELEQKQAHYSHERTQLSERLEQASVTIAYLTNEAEKQRQCERDLREQLQDSEGDRQGLRQVVAGQQQMLNERATQMLSLEEKHQHARQSLEHYRQEQLAQRGQELRRHDEQIRQLRQELHSMQNTQSAKQEELVHVYREQERLLNELRGLQTQLRQQAETLHESQQTNDRVATQLQVSMTDQVMLRERIKPYLLQHRADRRQLRIQGRQIETLQSLLRQLTPLN